MLSQVSTNLLVLLFTKKVTVSLNATAEEQRKLGTAKKPNSQKSDLNNNNRGKTLKSVGSATENVY